MNLWLFFLKSVLIRQEPPCAQYPNQWKANKPRSINQTTYSKILQLHQILHEVNWIWVEMTVDSLVTKVAQLYQQILAMTLQFYLNSHPIHDSMEWRDHLGTNQLAGHLYKGWQAGQVKWKRNGLCCAKLVSCARKSLKLSTALW